MLDRILLVDDDESLLFGYKVEMEIDGFIVDATTTLTGAREFLNNQKYKAVVTDLNLCGKESLEGLGVVSLAIKVQPETTIIVVTGISDEGIKKRALDAGAHVYLEKPVKASDLIQLFKKGYWDKEAG